MIYGRGKCLYRVLRLAACSGARRFASRGLNTRDRREAWRPLVLRWRLSRRRLENVLASRAEPHSQVSWFPQFHFHFASFMNDLTRFKPMPGTSVAAGSQPKQVVMDHRWLSVPTATAPLQPGTAKRPWREIYERNGSRMGHQAPVTSVPGFSWPRNGSRIEDHAPVATSAPRSSWPRNNSPRKEHAPVTPAPRLSWLPLAQQLGTWRKDHPRHLFERMPEVRVGMRREGQPQSLPARSQIWQHWHQVFSLRQPRPGDQAPPRAPGSKALPVQYERAEELVWRRVLQLPLHSDEHKRAPEPSDSISSTQARSQPGYEPAASVAPLLERAAATQITKLDPGVLDRLTDNVIHRVEQRMRIERQRRGL